MQLIHELSIERHGFYARRMAESFVSIPNSNNVLDAIIVFKGANKTFDHIVEPWAEAAACDDSCLKF